MVDRILKYLPPFVVINVLLTKIITAIATAVDLLNNEIIALQDCYYIKKGLRLSLSEKTLLFKGTEADSDLQTRFRNRYSILKARATEDGITDELTFLYPSASVAFYGTSHCGIIVDQTYLGVDNQAIIDVNKLITVTSAGTVDQKDLLPYDTQLLTL